MAWEDTWLVVQVTSGDKFEKTTTEVWSRHYKTGELRRWDADTDEWTTVYIPEAAGV